MVLNELVRNIEKQMIGTVDAQAIVTVTVPPGMYCNYTLFTTIDLKKCKYLSEKYGAYSMTISDCELHGKRLKRVQDHTQQAIKCDECLASMQKYEQTKGEINNETNDL